MSADNCIAILMTTSNFAREQGGVFRNLSPHTCLHYRVAHVQGVDAFDWYLKTQPYNLGAFIKDTWPEEPVYLSLQDARNAAEKLLSEKEYVEYGIVEIDARKFHYYGE